ncbi:sulfurtransferase [Pseudomonas sp. PDM23]|uniref:sulfurtransferase n=1 Tax=unclassified Pseudomonas TaxID=196821 RepID=UPI00177E781D|nr:MULTISPECIES: rhodanese-like domain-containing protein [unclassified Pseudomonas]MBD9579175.1 sulfurtransferase [Pseudomonas sp. PDM23]MBD9672839.1 sulfurtransferase [Pseudomonas sp. PDM21]
MSEPLINANRLAAVLDDPRLCLLDASVELAAPQFDSDYRAQSGYAGWLAGHIRGARHADLLGDLADVDAPFSFALPEARAALDALQRLGTHDDSLIVIYDRSDGFWAARLWWMLRSLGIDATVLDGGLRSWIAAGFSLEHGESREAGNGALSAPAKYRDGFWIDRRDVEKVVAGNAHGTLVCALSTALFDGSAVTRYARRGHIPGSSNLPARSLFDEDGCYLRGAALSEALAELRQAEPPLLLYCGGGISAAALALALTLAGETRVAIYDGSLQEWAAEPSLPLTTGAAPA